MKSIVSALALMAFVGAVAVPAVAQAQTADTTKPAPAKKKTTTKKKATKKTTKKATPAM